MNIEDDATLRRVGEVQERALRKGRRVDLLRRLRDLEHLDAATGHDLVIELLDLGMTLDEIADHADVSRARVEELHNWAEGSAEA